MQLFIIKTLADNLADTQGLLYKYTHTHTYIYIHYVTETQLK